MSDSSLPVKQPFIEEEARPRQPEETGPAFFASCLYRDYGGGRSIRKVVEAAELSQRRISIFRAWSKKYQW